jgi:hypothetical protein
MSFVTPIAPASTLRRPSSRCNARASTFCHIAATEGDSDW